MGGEQHLLEAHGGIAGEAVVQEVAKRLASPAAAASRAMATSRSIRVASNAVLADQQGVATSVAGHCVGAQNTAQLRRRGLQRVGRPLVAPQLVDQPVVADWSGR